jgi:hypothetical protein
MKQHALILEGKKGEKIFNEIYNGPKIPYKKLNEESEEIKKQWKAEENKGNCYLHDPNNVRSVRYLKE